MIKRNPAFSPHRSDRDADEISNFIVACQTDDESFDLLLDAIETPTPRDDLDLCRLHELIAKLLPRALVTGRELGELLALTPDTVVGPNQLALGMRKAISGQTGEEGRDFKPADVREAALLLLDGPSPEEGLRRLLRFVDWLAGVASAVESDDSIAERLRDLAVQVGRAHHMTPAQWQIPAEATRQDVVGAASATGTQRASAENADNRDRSLEWRSQPLVDRRGPTTVSARHVRPRQGKNGDTFPATTIARSQR